MAIIKTQRNWVYAYDPQPDDVFVRVGWTAPGDGNYRRTITLPYQPISTYEEAVDWAVSIADQMAYPIHVLPLCYSDIRNTGRFDRIRDALAIMTDQEHDDMQKLVAETCAVVMRDSTDWQVRADAYELLVQLRVTAAANAGIR